MRQPCPELEAEAAAARRQQQQESTLEDSEEDDEAREMLAEYGMSSLVVRPTSFSAAQPLLQSVKGQAYRTSSCLPEQGQEQGQARSVSFKRRKIRGKGRVLRKAAALDE